MGVIQVDIIKEKGITIISFTMSAFKWERKVL